MGDWGIFPTELSQQQKKLELELSIIPYTREETVYEEASSFQCPVLGVQLLGSNTNIYENNQFVWDGKNIRMTALKASQDGEDIIMRFVNFSDENSVLTISKTDWINNLCLSNILEESGELLYEYEGVWTILVKPFEIITLKSKQNKRGERNYGCKKD